VNLAFFIASAIAAIATVAAITRTNAVHALLYFVVSLLAVAVVFHILGAPFAAALEVIVYAGAIMVLFVFVVMMLNVGPAVDERERAWTRARVWIGPALLAGILLAELAWLAGAWHTVTGQPPVIDAHAVGVALLGPYLLAVEAASMLLLAALIGAFHLGRAVSEAPRE